MSHSDALEAKNDAAEKLYREISRLSDEIEKDGGLWTAQVGKVSMLASAYANVAGTGSTTDGQ